MFYRGYLRNFCYKIGKGQDYSARYYKSSGSRIMSWDAPENSTPEQRVEYLTKIQKLYGKMTGLDIHPKMTKFHKSHRTLETVNPGEFERVKAKEFRRKRDRATVADFCKKILYIHDKHIPK